MEENRSPIRDTGAQTGTGHSRRTAGMAFLSRPFCPRLRSLITRGNTIPSLSSFCIHPRGCLLQHLCPII